MSIEWYRETSNEIEYSGESQGNRRATRSWLFKVTTPAVSPALISTSIPVAFNESHPNVAGIRAKKFRVRPVDNTGMLWSAIVEYESATEEDQQEDQDSQVPGRPSIWGGSSSVTTGPVYKDKDGDMMTNSAGDPLEDLTAEFAEERLTLTTYYTSHTQWMTLSKEYTNVCNQDTWNGGAPYTWKCQGCSKKLNIETNDTGQSLVYWEVTWEFAYRTEGWQHRPWDIGFAQLVDDEGTPSTAGTKRSVIKGQDGKGVRQPVALVNGTAKEAGDPPDELEFKVYQEKNFGGVFGQVFTPRA